MESDKMTLLITPYLSELYWYNFGLGFVNKILGIDFFRCFEYTIGVTEIPLSPTMKVLDIGETKFGFFPLYLVEKKGVEVTVLDIDEGIKKLGKIAEKRDLKINTVIDNAESMPFQDSTFDVIYCISTIEHIPQDGDKETMREIKRVLKPGGKAFITIPYGSQYNEGQWGRWFIRTYDYAALRQRLIFPSGLETIKIGFFGSDNTRRYINLLYKPPKLIRHLAGWTHALFAKFTFPQDRGNREDAGLAWLLLKKG